MGLKVETILTTVVLFLPSLLLAFSGVLKRLPRIVVAACLAAVLVAVVSLDMVPVFAFSLGTGLPFLFLAKLIHHSATRKRTIALRLFAAVLALLLVIPSGDAPTAFRPYGTLLLLLGYFLATLKPGWAVIGASSSSVEAALMLGTVVFFLRTLPWDGSPLSEWFRQSFTTAFVDASVGVVFSGVVFLALLLAMRFVRRGSKAYAFVASVLAWIILFTRFDPLSSLASYSMIVLGALSYRLVRHPGQRHLAWVSFLMVGLFYCFHNLADLRLINLRSVYSVEYYQLATFVSLIALPFGILLSWVHSSWGTDVDSAPSSGQTTEVPLD